MTPPTATPPAIELAQVETQEPTPLVSLPGGVGRQGEDLFEGRLAVKVERAAHYLDISRSRAYELVKSGDLPSIRVGSAGVRVCVAGLMRFASEGGVQDHDPSPAAQLAAAKSRQRRGAHPWR